ncbi:PDIA3 isoform 5 [Pan troglodytes]|uniref:Protein disulfide isomerase family A member 3 n=4 Tax=Homininae TaxID=207598 RepID=F8WBW5_HUMAN|nr:protein disulfide isomerase family A member 3 [Homo sapiens]KAI4057516.1 protein disulfide isomerase family A member 3 [Homo sapiens]PNI75198.1 PDIA3 isoform 5 [Pan troglodytes]
MRLRRLALFPGVALLLAAARLAAASDVLELTDDNFESRISDTGSAGLMLVEFFAPWLQNSPSQRDPSATLWLLKR